MTRLRAPETMPLEVALAEKEAAEQVNPLAMDPPKLSGVHEKTKNVIERALNRDAKEFDELARAQTSGQ